MRGVLTKIQPLHADLVPPANAVPAGITPDHKQLWKLTRKMARAVPRTDPDTGERTMRRHPINGEALYGLNKPEIYDQELVFYLESDGQGNVYMVEYRPPTPEQLAEQARQEQIAAMQGQLAEVFVDEGISPADLVKAIRDGRAAVGVPEVKRGKSRKPQTDGGAAGDGAQEDGDEAPSTPAPSAVAESFVEFPIIKSPGVWQLCDGSIFGDSKDKKKKDEAEAANAEAKARLAATAEAQAQAAADQQSVPEV